MAKLPKDSPSEAGQIVELRGRGGTGELIFIHPESDWCQVAWSWEDWNVEDPIVAHICHRSELRIK